MKNLILGLSLLSTIFMSSGSNAFTDNKIHSDELFFENCFSVYLDRYDAMIEGGISPESAQKGATIFFELCLMRNDGEALSGPDRPY